VARVDFERHAAQVRAIKAATDRCLTDEGKVKVPKLGAVSPDAVHRAEIPQAGGELKIKILNSIRSPDNESWSLSYKISAVVPKGASLDHTVSFQPSASMSLSNTDVTAVVPPTTGSLASGATASTAGGTTRPRADTESPPPDLDPASRRNMHLFPDYSGGAYFLDGW
jgi:hypothetical protein